MIEENNNSRGGKAVFDGAFLKILAIVTMLIDHVTVDFGMNYGYTVYEIGRGIGRIAFPIFCFLLAEGFYYTKSRWKYIARLLIFAAVSEIPFDMAFSGTLFDSSYQNVFFTLMFGGLAITLIGLVDGDRGKAGEAPPVSNVFLRFLLILIATAGCALGAEFLSTDYGAGGVCTIIVMYVLAERKKPAYDLMRVRISNTLGFAVGVLLLGLTCGSIEYLAFVDLIFIWFYNSKRGRQLKYFFYAFYPVHLFIIGLAAYGSAVFNFNYLPLFK